MRASVTAALSTFSVSVLVTLLVIRGSAYAADSAADPSAGPTANGPPAGPTAAPPAGPKVDGRQVAALITQLGDDDFKKREAAVEGLVRVGPGALPALEEARSGNDPEVVARVEAIARRIRTADKPPYDAKSAAKVLAWVSAPGMRGIVAARNSGPDFVEIERTSPRKDWQVLMRRGKTGIDITLTFPSEANAGRTEKAECHAACESELKRSYPHFYQIHEALLLNLNPDDGMRTWWRQFNPEPKE